MTWTNDNLADALVITGDFSFGPAAWPGSPEPTAEPGEDTSFSANTIWFTWTAPALDDLTRATVTVNTWDSPRSDAQPQGLDTWIRIYSTAASNPGFGDLTPVDSNDDNGNLYFFNSALTLVPTSGTRYYFQVGAFSGEQGTLLVNFIVSVLKYQWSDWRYPSPVVGERVHDYDDVQFVDAGVLNTYANRATGSVDSSTVLPYIKGTPTLDFWDDARSTETLTDGPSGTVDTFFGRAGPEASFIGAAICSTEGTSMLLSGGGIGNMWEMGEHSKQAFPLDMLSRLTQGDTPSGDPDLGDSVAIEFGTGNLIGAQFVIQGAASLGFGVKENVDTASSFFDSAFYTDNSLALDGLTSWTEVDIVELPETTWAGSRRHTLDDQAAPPYSAAILPFVLTRDDAFIGTVLTTLEAPTTADPFEQRYMGSLGALEAGCWHDHPDYASPVYTQLKADSSLVIAAIPRAFSIGSVPQPPRDALQTFPSGYHPGTKYNVTLYNSRGTLANTVLLPDSYVGWVASWQPPPYRLLLPLSSTVPPLRQWQRSDTANRTGQVTTNQNSLRQGVGNSYL